MPGQAVGAASASLGTLSWLCLPQGPITEGRAWRGAESRGSPQHERSEASSQSLRILQSLSTWGDRQTAQPGGEGPEGAARLELGL